MFLCFSLATHFLFCHHPFFAAVVSPGGTAVVRTTKRSIEVGGDAYWAEIYGDSGGGGAGSSDDDENE